jgi:dTDP-4-amino-4,6-dideoxygalactose transaminase
MKRIDSNDRIWLSSPHMDGNELKYIKEAFELNWVSPVGPHIDKFEKALTDYTGQSHSVALSSGTAAIHLALIMLGVKQGDNVICQSFTFAGSANPILYQGANPIFIDSEEDTWNMDPNYLEDSIKQIHKSTNPQLPKAIIPVHLYGMPYKVNEINEIAARYEIPVIEDAAEALGSEYGGKKCGSLGDIGILSFNGNKIITTSGGGAILSNKKEWITKAKFLSTQARDPAPHYEHSEVGYNYRLSNISAGIGVGQMETLESKVKRRREVFDFFTSNLQEYGFNFLKEPPNAYSNRWLTTATVDQDITGISPSGIMKELEKNNIESRPLWKPMHMQPVFNGAQYYGGKVSENLFKNGVCLPSGSNMSDSDVERVVEVVKKASTPPAP